MNASFAWLYLNLGQRIKSPLFGKSADDLKRGDMRVLASMIGMDGMDGTFMPSVYAYDQIRGREHCVRWRV